MTASRFTDEQRAAVADRRGSRLLAANAGSGKTAVIVERFVEAVLADGVDVNAILALTFTEKAAGELRERVRRRFEELDEHDRARAAEAAWVGTIHGFCARVLRAHPLPAGLDPGFAVLDEPAARRLAGAAWERAVDEWAQAEGRPAVDLVAAYGPSLRELVTDAHAELRSRGVSAPALGALPAAPALGPVREELATALREASALLARAPGGARVEDARAALESCDALLARWPADGEARGASPPAPGELEPARLGNGAKVLGEEACLRYRRAWESCRAACADHHALGALKLLDSLLRRFSERFAGAKRARTALDFEDLQLRVRGLLAADAELRQRWAERFELIMVDEFQDTNRLQLDVLRMLERDNLLAVGDEFQAIYGFRHADVAIFQERRAALGAAGTRRLQANFRSARPLLDGINAAFAPVFGEAFSPLVAGTAADEPAGPELRLFDPDRPRTGGGAPIELLLTDASGWDDPDVTARLGLALPDVQPWRRAEARLVARRLRGELDAGRRAGDLVVLVRAAASLRLFEQALEEAGVPTYVVGGRGYWSQEPVRDALAYLSVLANPLDELALYSVLASPFGAVGADGLMELARAARERRTGAWAALMAAFGPAVGAERADWAGGLPEADRAALARLVPVLAEERALAERLAPEVLLERGMTRTECDLAVLAQPGGERRLANVRKLMRLARDFERSEGRSLRGFLDHARTQDLSQAREGDAALESEGLDAVRLMTIHRAKGLEFPVVCVADLGRSGGASRPPLLLAPDGRVGLRLRTLGFPESCPALAYDELLAARLAAEDAEERRLLYVAMTRAREKLLISGTLDCARPPAPRPGGPPIAWVAPALLGGWQELAAAPPANEAGGLRARTVERDWDGRRAPVLLRVGTPAALDALLPPGETGPGAPAPYGTSVSRAETAAPPALRRAPALPGLPARLSYSSLGEYARCGYRFYLQRVLRLRDVEPPPGASPAAAYGLDARLRGTLVHELLEELDFARPVPPPAEAVTAAGVAHGADLDAGEVADVRGLIARFAGSRLCARIAAARAVRREAPFAFPVEATGDGMLVHGVVDVLASEAEGVLVVDYKTDRIGEGDPEELTRAAYGTQRIVYALAALRDGAASVEVAHCYLERPDEPASAVFRASDAPELAEQLLGLCEGVLSKSFPVSPQPHRDLCATCPGRLALCSHPPAATLRPLEAPAAGAAQDSAGTFSASGGPS